MTIRFEHVEHDDLDDPRDGKREECPDEAREIDAHEDGEQDEERVQPDGPAIHGGLEHVILELLVQHEEDRHHDPGDR